MSSTMNVPIAVAILLVIGCSFYYYRKMKSEQEKQANQRTTENLKESQEKQQDIDKEQELKEKDILEIEFTNNYKIREIIKSDHNDIIEICSNIYDETDYCHNQFFNFLNDDKCIFYGCLHKETNKIIGIAVIKIIDGGYTAFLLGVRIHLNHRRKHIASILTKYIINKSLKQYESINRFRSIHQKSNNISSKFHDKMGFNILDNIQFLYHSSHCKQPKNGWYLFQQRMDEIDEENKNNNIYNEYLCNFEAIKCRDIDNIICILLNYYKQNDIFIEWKIFDLKISEENIDDLEEENESNQDSEEEEIEDIDNNNNNNDNNDNEEDEDILGGGYEVIHNEDINVSQIDEEKQENIDDIEYDDEHDIDDIVDEEIEINDTTYDDGHIYENEDIAEESVDEEDEDLYEDDVSEDIDDNDYDDREYEEEYNKMSVDIRSVQDFKSHLFDQINGGNINVYIINTNDMNQEDGALCFEFRNIEIRKHCTFYHIYGNNQMAIISMIKSCYDLWKQKIYNKDTTETIDFYINSDVIMKNDKLKWLFQGADIAYIAQKDIHLNHNVNGDLLVDEESN